MLHVHCLILWYILCTLLCLLQHDTASRACRLNKTMIAKLLLLQGYLSGSLLVSGSQTGLHRTSGGTREVSRGYVELLQNQNKTIISIMLCGRRLRSSFGGKRLKLILLNLILLFHVVKSLLVFPSTYLCEQGFSSLCLIKTKHRASLAGEADLRVRYPELSSWLWDIKHTHPIN